MAVSEAPLGRAELEPPVEWVKPAGKDLLRRSWHVGALGLITLISVVMNFYGLGSGGYGNQYYAVGVRSMLDSLHNFFFVSYDPAGFVTIDKPPLGFWLQVASAKILGFTPFAILLPQALAGVLAVLLLYHLIRARFGVVAGLLAALALAVSPISVVTDRNNTIDGTLALVLVTGAWAVLRAAETGKLRYLLLAAALVGIGFNVKMAEALLVVPAFGALYLMAAPHSWRTRIGHLALAGVLLFAISLSWITAVDVVPASARPWVGSTQNDSELSLASGYNGIDRVLGMFRRGFDRAGTNPAFGQSPANGTSATSGPSGTGSASASAFPSGQAAAFPGPNGGPAGRDAGQFGGGGMFGTGSAGPLRLFGQSLGSQIGWILPLALVGGVALALNRRWQPQRDRQQQSLILWGGWLLTMGVFFSVAGFFHTYYLTVMAPAVAALFGAGTVTLWQHYRAGGWRGWLLPIALLLTLGEQVYLLSADPTWARLLVPALALFTGIGLLLLASARIEALASITRRIPMQAAAGVAVLALLIAPAVWGAIPVAEGAAQQMPSAGPTRLDGPGGYRGRGDSASQSPALAAYLQAHQGTAKYLVAVPSSMQGDQLILQTNQPVMALGGFSGGDPILTVDEFAKLVQQGEVRYALVSSGNGFGGNRQSPITQWITAHGTVVPASDWGGTTTTSQFDGPFGGSSQLYQLSA